MIDHGYLLHPDVIDQPPAYHRARRLALWTDPGRQKELDGEVLSLIESENLEWLLVDLQDPVGQETGVVAEEPVLRACAAAHIAEPVAYHEGASVQHVEGALRQAPSPHLASAPLRGRSIRRRRPPHRRRSAGTPTPGSHGRRCPPDIQQPLPSRSRLRRESPCSRRSRARWRRRRGTR